MQRNSNFLFRGILKTDPVDTDPNADTVLYTGLNKPNCRAYILAAKSFLCFYPRVSVVVQDDGTMDEKCIQELCTHIHGITIYSRKSMDEYIQKHVGNQVRQVMPDIYDCHILIPLKLLNVIYRFNNKKVIFLDSDMIVLRRPDDIIKWIEDPYMRDFYSGGGSLLAETFHDIGFEFKTIDISNFNSGFLGIGGSISEDFLADTFTRIRNYDPLLFKNWEIEQAIWSVLLSSRENPLNIDELSEIYIGSGWRTVEELRAKAIIVHFVGAIRFKNLRYLRLAWMLFKELRKK